MMRSLRLLVALLAYVSALWPGAAAAHAILMDSQPPAGATAPPGDATLILRFNSRIDAARSRVALRRGQDDSVLPPRSAEAGNALAVRATLTPGAYVIRWQVLAMDGHVTRGEVPFTVGER